jgi:catechol-2,3-dioxygenase
MHIHVSVDDLIQSTAFYSHLFGAEPTVLKPDYAKWMLDDPRINFAISQRGETPGLNHLGIQVDTAGELDEIQARLQSADMGILTETGTTCCYAKSDKHWVQDPNGIAWEAYHTLDSAPTFNAASDEVAQTGCCAPTAEKISFIPRQQA